ncbi:neurotrypsin-like [Diadema setosum]|uniref:neurotrypsin-like n=1 Tax=Diadema setosum TaxID=31175 RepID=UPI003B3AD1BB
MRDAHVVCRDLGYSSASASYRSAHFGQGSGPFWVDSALCDGTENSLVYCLRWPWGCHRCDHSRDAGVRCEGDRSDNAVNESVTSGLDYRVNRFTYYNVSSELTFTPTAADNEGVLQCRLIGSERSRTLEVQHAPADNIILIKIVDKEGGQETNGLKITCDVDPRDQPYPLLGIYEIALNGVTESASSSPSLILESIPSECVEISCTGINNIGMTNATTTYCPRSDGKMIKLSMSLLYQSAFNQHKINFS